MRHRLIWSISRGHILVTATVSPTAAFGALETQGIQLLAAGCTGASIYIVVPDKKAQAVIRCLSELSRCLKQPLDEDQWIMNGTLNE